MPIPTNVQTLLSGNVVEWERIEFKETWDAAASLKTVVAFANDIDNWGGGYIVIGVKNRSDDDNRPSPELCGIPVGSVDRIMKEMLNKCKLIKPDYLPITEVTQYKGKTVLIVWCPGGQVRPYSCPKDGNPKNARTYYIRKFASTIEAQQNDLTDLYTLANRVPFDDRVNQQAEISDMSLALIQEFLHEIGSSLESEVGSIDFYELCRSMNIASISPEYSKPLNVGLMFFNLHPERFFPCAQIDIVEFPDDSGDSIVENTFTGPIHHQLRMALEYLRNKIIQEKVQKLPDVPEARRFYNYPFAAVEESLANAIYHKGYDEREPIEVRVEADRIIIVSHPGADRSISAEALKTFRAYNRRYRNRRIGEFLKELHLTEGRNTGFLKIRKALHQNGSPDPLFETDDERTYFTTTLFIHPDFLSEATTSSLTDEKNEISKDISKADDKTISKAGKQHKRNKYDTEAIYERILALCTVPRSVSEIAETLSYKSRSHVSNKLIQPLLADGRLAKTIPDKPSNPNQRYITVRKTDTD